LVGDPQGGGGDIRQYEGTCKDNDGCGIGREVVQFKGYSSADREN
jgi:hypothetical protein